LKNCLRLAASIIEVFAKRKKIRDREVSGQLNSKQALSDWDDHFFYPLVQNTGQGQK
jgi:hypothetical protein